MHLILESVSSVMTPEGRGSSLSSIIIVTRGWHWAGPLIGQAVTSPALWLAGIGSDSQTLVLVTDHLGNNDTMINTLLGIIVFISIQSTIQYGHNNSAEGKQH